MKYEDFQKFIEQNCCYETIYDDSEGRAILVMRLLDAYGMVNKAVELEFMSRAYDQVRAHRDQLLNDQHMWVEAKLKEKNT